MKRASILAFILSAALLFSACGKDSTLAQIMIYRVITPANRIDGALIYAQEMPFTPGVGEINGAVAAFNSQPDVPGLENPLPAGGKIVGYTLEGGRLRLLTEGCEGLSGIDLVLLQCCAVLTFCAIEGVESVSIYSEDTELCAPLSADQIILTDTSR